MNTHVLRALAFLLALAAPPTAAAGVSARAGLVYSQADSWSPAGVQASPRQHLDVDLGLDASGVIVSRDVVDYRLRTSWSRVTDDRGTASTTTRDLFTYSGRASLFQNRVSPVGLSVFASRGESEFSTSAAADSFGRGIATSAGGGLSIKGQNLPTMTAGYTWSNQQNVIAGQPLRDATLHSLSSNLAFTTPVFQATASYLGELREGTWEADNFALHGASLGATTRIGDAALSLEASSSFTIPEELGPGMFEQQTTTFGAGTSFGDAGRRRSFRYSYGHTLTDTADVPTGEITRQGLRYEGDHFATRKTFFTRWLVDTSLAETRSGETELRTTGETLGLTVHWRREAATTVEVNGGPRVSLLQADGAESGGFGGVAAVRVNRKVGVHSLHGEWTASYGDDLYANAGWQLTQGLGATLDGPMGTGRYNLALRASAFRTHSPVTGDGAGRRLEAIGSLTSKRTSLDARASLTSGIMGATPQQFTSDGLLLPAPFNSTTVDASLGAQVRLFPGLSSSLHLRLGRSDIPGRPLLHEVGAAAALTYRYAAFGVSVEDRVSRVETALGWTTSNTVFATVFRSFSW